MTVSGRNRKLVPLRRFFGRRRELFVVAVARRRVRRHGGAETHEVVAAVLTLHDVLSARTRRPLQPRSRTSSPSASARAAQTGSGISATGQRRGSWWVRGPRHDFGAGARRPEDLGADLGVPEVGAGASADPGRIADEAPRGRPGPAERAEPGLGLARVVQQRGRGPAVVGGDRGRQPVQHRDAFGAVRRGASRPRPRTRAA